MANHNVINQSQVISPSPLYLYMYYDSSKLSLLNFYIQVVQYWRDSYACCARTFERDRLKIYSTRDQKPFRIEKRRASTTNFYLTVDFTINVVAKAKL